MPQLEHIEAIEKRLWTAADTLRANSNYASNEYSLPVMGLVFLRHAYSRYPSVKDAIEANLPRRGSKARALTKEDFSQQSAIFLQPKAQFDTLVALTDSDDRVRAFIEAMESIESDYESLRGVLPKSEYQELDNAVLGQLLRTLNPDELKKVSGDVFGRICEYFLTQFADRKAHDGGEFFTPHLAGLADRPCAGAGKRHRIGPGLRFRRHVRAECPRGGAAPRKPGLETHLLRGGKERHHDPPGENEPGGVWLGRRYPEDHQLLKDPRELLGKAGYVMANPPFNVDEIDADKIKKDPCLPFGLPGVNKKGKVSNGNYICISYFYSDLNEPGRAGLVMSSQVSSAGRYEANVRRKLMGPGDVDIMIAGKSTRNWKTSTPRPCNWPLPPKEF